MIRAASVSFVVLLAMTVASAVDWSGLQEAELLLVNGKIVTVDEKFSIAEAMAVRDGRILAVGSTAEVQKFAGPATRKVDLHGRMVTPGFIDGHPHVYEFESVSLRDVKSVKDILDIVRAEASKAKPGAWIVLEPPGEPPYHFHMPEKLAEKRYPTKQELDGAAPRNPVYIKSSAFHEHPTALFNSLALEELGITKDSGDIKGVKIVRDTDGDPIGQVIGNLTYFSQSPLRDKLWGVAPRPSFQQQVKELKKDIATYNAGGVTAIYEGHGMPETTIALYNELWNRGELTLRSYLVKTVNQFQPTDQVIKQLDNLAAFRGRGIGDTLFRVGGIGLIFGDNVGFGAGFMPEPYMGPYGQKWRGLQLIEEDKLYQVVRAAAERGIRVNLQASGRSAIDITLRVFDRVNQEIPITDRRFVLEHCQFPTEEHMQTVKRLGVIPTTVTNFLWGQGNAYLRHYGRELTEQAIPVKTWLRHDVPLAQSSDYGPDDAMFVLWQSIARKNGWTGETLGAQESITREQAIRIYTINAARLAYWEDQIGSLEKGKFADFVVLDRDILTVPVDEIRETKILATVVGGKVVHGSLP